MAEMLTYASTLKSITSDRGSYHMEFDHYEPVPRRSSSRSSPTPRPRPRGRKLSRLTRGRAQREQGLRLHRRATPTTSARGHRQGLAGPESARSRARSSSWSCATAPATCSAWPSSRTSVPSCSTACGRVPLESSLADHRHGPRGQAFPGGFELASKSLSVIHEAAEYPIQPKEHGVEFLFDQRHLYLRSGTPQSGAARAHEVVQACRDYFYERGFV